MQARASGGSSHCRISRSVLPKVDEKMSLSASLSSRAGPDTPKVYLMP